jgi:signal transduction histidine kinase
MLSFGRSTRADVTIEHVDLGRLVNQTLEDLHYLPGYEKLEFRVNHKFSDIEFWSEHSRLQIVLANIIANAIKYRNIHAEKSWVEITTENDSEEAIITIADNGIGIDKKYLDKIFNMFYRATEKSDGSGLGLYIVKQTVERLGGNIDVFSEIEVGTRLVISLPNRSKVPQKSTANN